MTRTLPFATLHPDAAAVLAASAERKERAATVALAASAARKERDDAARAERKASIAKFRTAMGEASRVLAVIAKFPNLPAHYRAQAQAAAGIAGLHLHIIQMVPDTEDGRAVNDDLDALCHVVDPLVLAVAEHAGEHFGIDDDLIRVRGADQLRYALEGNLTHVITEAAQECEEGLRMWARS